MPQDPLIGYTLAGKYTIVELVAEEALGRVYSADLAAGTGKVNVKILHPHLIDDAEIFGRFSREMIATATVQHPNTVSMLDFGEHRVFHYIVLEQLAARSLHRVLLDQERLSWERVAHIAAQIASALDAAHREGIVHRDLTSHNILLLDNARGDYVKIRDFGLSKLHGESSDVEDLTSVGSRVGSINYMAPEYIEHGFLDGRGDLYALGVLMFEMLVGRPPFKGKSGQVMEAHCSTVPPDPRSLVPDTPPWLSELILDLLRKSPDTRPQTGGEVLLKLESGVESPLTPPELIALTAENETAIQEEVQRRKDRGAAPTSNAVSLAAWGMLALLLAGLLALFLLASVVVLWITVT